MPPISMRVQAAEKRIEGQTSPHQAQAHTQNIVSARLAAMGSSDDPVEDEMHTWNSPLS